MRMAQLRINAWSPARVYTDYLWNADGTKAMKEKTWVVTTHLLATTPAKIRMCRTCRGQGRVPYRDWCRWDQSEATWKPVDHTLRGAGCLQRRDRQGRAQGCRPSP